MKWYAAHVVLAPLTAEQNVPIDVFENVYLVSGVTEEQALRRAEALGRAEEVVDDDLTLDGAPAKMTFLGVRKIVSISNAVGPQDEAPPADGCELTYSRIRFETLGEAQHFAEGGEAKLTSLE